MCVCACLCVAQLIRPTRSLIPLTALSRAGDRHVPCVPGRCAPVRRLPFAARSKRFKKGEGARREGLAKQNTKHTGTGATKTQGGSASPLLPWGARTLLLRLTRSLFSVEQTPGTWGWFAFEAATLAPVGLGCGWRQKQTRDHPPIKTTARCCACKRLCVRWEREKTTVLPSPSPPQTLARA